MLGGLKKIIMAGKRKWNGSSTRKRKTAVVRVIFTSLQTGQFAISHVVNLLIGTHSRCVQIETKQNNFLRSKKKKRKDNFPFIWRNSFPRNVSVDACLVFKKRKENTLTRRSARMMSKEKRRKEMKRYMSLYIIVKRFGVNLIFGDVCVSARREKKGGRNGLPP